MKKKISFLIAASVFLALTTRAQYVNTYPENRVVVHAQLGIPVPAIVQVGFYHSGGYNNQRVYENKNRHDAQYYNNYRRDWREIEYERYCRDRHNRWMSREDFYRAHCNYQPATSCDPRQNVYYRR